MTQVSQTAEIAYLTIAEVARRYRRSGTAVHGWIREGVSTPLGVVRLRAAKIGGMWLIDPADLEAFIQAQNPDTHVAVAEQQDAAARLREQECAALDRQLRRDPNEKE